MKNKPAPAEKNQKTKWLIPLITTIVFLGLATATFLQRKATSQPSDFPSAVVPTQETKSIPLPSPAYKSNTSVESALKSRRSIRSFVDQSVPLKVASQLLWSAQGVTAEWGERTTPSAKSTFSLSVYLIANKIDGLNSGQYLYVPGERTPVHTLTPIKEGEFGEAIFTSLNQNSFKDVPGVLVITGDMAKMASSFGGIAHDKEVYLEAGHAAQNLFLQAETLKIGLVVNSTFNDSIIRNIISIPDNETIIYLIPFGVPKN